MYFDSHCHLDFDAFDSDRGEVFKQSRHKGVTRWMVAGVEAKHWARQRALARKEAGCDWAVGVHPQYVESYSDSEWLRVIEALPAAFEANTPPKAVGEIGLHRSRNWCESVQTARFSAQLRIARALQMPVILHVVGAHGVALDILNTEGPLQAGGVVHSFSGSAEVARRYINLNLHLGVTARWSQGGAKKLRAALCEIDVSSLLLESDAPDQSAIKDLRNDPTAVIDAAAWVAEQKGLTTNGVLVQCSKNAAALFG